jgi:alkanesulfonate monooxygenase SsuD/methylene tetrahydromethanopterin reductase-like flavin-dependent oxidoreductase (luciferase family)
MQSTTRRAEAERLAAVTYEDILAEQVVNGTPEAVAERLAALRAELGFSTLSVWMNVGGLIPHERVLASMRLFAERVAPRL